MNLIPSESTFLPLIVWAYLLWNFLGKLWKTGDAIFVSRSAY